MQQDQIIALIKWLLVFIFLGYLYHHFVNAVEPVLIYHLQQPPFYLIKNFFNQYTDYPGGIAEYAGNFVAQLLHANVQGSLLIVLSVLTLLLTAKYIFSQISTGGKGFLWMIVPAIPAVILFQNYYFPYYVFLKIFLAFIGMAIFIAMRNHRIVHFLFFVLLIPVLYYTIGATGLLVFLSSIMIYSLLSSPFSAKVKIVYAVISLVAAIAVPYVGYKYLFNIPMEKTWWDLLPAQPVVIRYVPDKALYILISVLPFILFLLGLAQIIKKWFDKVSLTKEFTGKLVPYKNIIAIFCIAVVPTAMYFVLKQQVITKLNNQKRSVLLTDYYTVQGKWNKAIEAALSAKEYDLFLNYNYNRAVFNAGKIGDWFFRYPQLLGTDGLFPDKIASGQIALAASDFYYELGYISEALHWAYEAQSTTPYNPRVLQRLVKVHLIEGRLEAAATYLGILKTAFFQDDFVKKYTAYLQDTSLLENDSEFQEKRAFMPLNTYTPGTINQKLKLLLQTNNKNQRALEFLAMSYLLSHQVGDFINILPAVLKYYKELPMVYQEALLLYMAKTKATISYPFDDNTIQSFQHFFEYLKKYPDRKAAQNTLAQYYKGTYIYYITFQSPLITKMQLKAREVESY